MVWDTPGAPCGGLGLTGVTIWGSRAGQKGHMEVQSTLLRGFLGVLSSLEGHCRGLGLSGRAL